jgi:enoyl-CoA hydratase
MDRYSSYECLQFEYTDRILTVTLDSGAKLNAVNGRLHEELSTVFTAVREDELCDVVVLTGKGRAFSAGGDLAWLRDMTDESRDATFREARHIITGILECPKPILAAIEGPAIGLGATLALFCDIKIAGRNATIADPHVNIGVVAGDGGAVIWPWLIGTGRAKYHLMTGDPIKAEEAERIGLIERVVEPGTALAEAHTLAARLAKGHLAAIRGTKISVNKLLHDAVNIVLDTSLALEKETMASAEHKGAVEAFLQRLAG